MRDPGVDYYAILGVSRTASTAQVKKAFKKRALQLHPDRNPQGESLFKEVSTAYQILSDEHKRSEYDRVCALRPSGPPPAAPSRTAGHAGCAFRESKATQGGVRGQFTNGRYNVSGYTMRQDEHDDIVSMMRRDAEAARRADRCSSEYERWREQREREAQERREERAAAQAAAAQRAPTPPAGMPPRPGSAQRQHAKHEQTRALWEMHQKRFRGGSGAASPPSQAASGSAMPSSAHDGQTRPVASAEHKAELHRRAEQMRQKMAQAQQRLRTPSPHLRRNSAPHDISQGSPSDAVKELFNLRAREDSYDPTMPFQGMASGRHVHAQRPASAQGGGYGAWFKGVGAGVDGMADDVRSPFDKMGGVRPESPYHSTARGGCSTTTSSRDAERVGTCGKSVEGMRSSRATVGDGREEAEAPRPAPRTRPAEAPSVCSAGGTRDLDADSAHNSGSEAELQRYESLCERIERGLGNLAAQQKLQHEAAEQRMARLSPRGTSPAARCDVGGRGVEGAVPRGSREGSEAGYDTPTIAAVDPDDDVPLSAFGLHAYEASSGEIDVKVCDTRSSIGGSVEGDDDGGVDGDDVLPLAARELSSPDVAHTKPPRSAAPKAPPYVRPSTVSAMRTPWDSGETSTAPSTFAALMPTDREIQGYDAVQLESLEAALHQKLKLVRQVRVLQSIDKCAGGVFL